MPAFFEHSFTEPIWSIRFWGKPDEPRLWVETRGNAEAFWHSIDLATKEVSLLGKAPSDYAQLNFVNGSENEAIFIKLQQSKNPGIESVQTYSLNPLKLLTEEKSRSINPENAFSFQVPQHYEESQEYFKDFRTFFQQQFNETIAKGIDYFEGEDKLLFSYYLYEDGLKNILRVCDKGFKTEHTEVIAEGETIGFNTFQIFNRTLIYIKDKHQLIFYEF